LAFELSGLEVVGSLKISFCGRLSESKTAGLTYIGWPGGLQLTLVAGAGLEPATFGL